MNSFRNDTCQDLSQNELLLEHFHCLVNHWTDFQDFELFTCTLSCPGVPWRRQMSQLSTMVLQTVQNCRCRADHLAMFMSKVHWRGCWPMTTDHSTDTGAHLSQYTYTKYMHLHWHTATVCRVKLNTELKKRHKITNQIWSFKPNNRSKPLLFYL